jgi:alpha-tubulin suppressor-like RCC1 family protein
VDIITQLHFLVNFNLNYLGDNKVYSLGRNENGELGLNDKINRNEITENKFFENKKINSIICGGSFTIVISNYLFL